MYCTKEGDVEEQGSRIQNEINKQIDDAKSEEFMMNRNTRTILSSDQARVIFKSKPSGKCSKRSKAVELARIFGVSPKTIRDIWVGRTWYRATCQLDSTKPICTERLEKKLGRPRGSKDIKPRARKLPDVYHLDDSLPCEQLNIIKTEAAEQKSSFELQPMSRASLHEQCCSPLGFRCHATLCQSTPVDWILELPAAQLQFTDPFHDDWAFWPKERKEEDSD